MITLVITNDKETGETICGHVIRLLMTCFLMGSLNGASTRVNKRELENKGGRSTVLSLISTPGACKIEMKNYNFSVFFLSVLFFYYH